MTAAFFMLLFHTQQAAEESVGHPAWCDYATVCATKDPETNNNWICHDGETNPHMCDENRVMLLGRRSFIWGLPGAADSTKWPVPCIDDNDCTEKCYARRCQQSQVEGDTERLHVYVNGACGTIGPHVSASIVMGGTVEANAVLATIKCEVDTDDFVFPLSEEFVASGDEAITKFGQLRYATSESRVWDLRAKAEACSLCSLYTARNLNTHAWIEENQFWQCKVYKDSHDGDLENNCTHLFGNNIFVARENVRELETIGYDDSQPAYLVSGVVPKNYNEEWSAWTFSPPLLDSNGVPYTESMDPEELSADGPSRNYDHLNLPQLSGLYVNHNPNNANSFEKVWSFFGFAGSEIILDSSYYPVSPTMYASTQQWWSETDVDFRTKAAFLYHEFGPVLKDRYGGSFYEDTGRIEYFVPESLCSVQPSYCCHGTPLGPSQTMCASALPTGSQTTDDYDDSQKCYTVDGLVECGFGLKNSYGLNHAFRVLQCNARGGNFNTRPGYLPMDNNMFAADVLVVPRSWNSTQLRYGWAKLADLRDVDRTQYDRDAAGNTHECKFVGIPGQPYRDYCLRRDRGIGTNSPLCFDPNADADEAAQTGGIVFSALNQDQAVDEYAQGICCDDDEGIVCDYDCVQYVTKRETTTTTSTPTTTTTTLPETFLGDLMWPLILNNNGLFHSCSISSIQLTGCNQIDLPETTNAAYDAQVCAVEYAYFANDIASNFSLTFYDARTTAHTRCRDACTSWKQCVSYAYEDNTCTIYAPANCATEFSGSASAQEGECVEDDGIRYTALASTEARCADGYTLVLETILDAEIAYTNCAKWDDISWDSNDDDTYCAMAFGDYVCCDLIMCFTDNDDCPETVTNMPNGNGIQRCSTDPPTEGEYTLGQLVQLFGGGPIDAAYYYAQIQNYNPMDWSLLQNHFADNFVAGATESDNAVQKSVVSGTQTGANTVDAFDLYYGYHLCSASSPYRPRTKRTATLNDCMDYARDLSGGGVTMFVWTGRLHSCDVYSNIDTVGNWLVDVDQVVFRSKCQEIGGYYVAALINETPKRQRPTNAPVFGIKSADTTKRCPPRRTTTTTTETVSTGSSAEPQKAVYASVKEFCRTSEMRYIWPAFAEDGSTTNNKFFDYSADVGSILDDEGFPFQEDPVETNKIRFYLNPKLQPQCTVERPALDFVYGDGATATTTPTTTATTTTPTFVNRFTDDDTRVTLGVVIGVLSIGAVLSIVAAFKG